MTTPKKTLLSSSIVLISLGLTGYFLKLSPTALIPVFFGLILFICFFFYDRKPKLIAHISVGLVLLVFLALFMPLSKRISDQDIGGLIRVGLMQLSCLYSLICFIMSFAKARSK
ncbi:MAG: hypothetical protein CMG00_08005 [Candidatus Marinimicrobia bacterium]|nr:hypothetical protein [Candidatus Neomarinimicrobiota bacterium]|tara:strand:+ start:158 stop:499 length:342 start_codon:yes stop_codon:yes gene_type:complete